MIQKLTKKKAHHLRRTIEYVLGVNVTLNKSRKRNVVNARVIFSQILKERGYSSVCIGKALDKNHATVLHYFKSFTWNVEQDEDLKIGYEEVKYEFEQDYDPLYGLNYPLLKKEIYTLRNKNKELYSQIIDTKNLLSKEKRKDSRLEDIMYLIRERTVNGSEEQILRKLKTFYNGIYID